MRQNLPLALALLAGAMTPSLFAQDVLYEVGAGAGEALSDTFTLLSDVTGDGVPEFAVLTRHHNYRNATIHDGADGSVLTVIPDALFADQPALAAAGDHNGDGFLDLLVAHQDGVGVHSATDGAQLFLLPKPTRPYGFLSLASIGDLDGDGFPEILIGYGQRRIVGGCDSYNITTYGPGFARIYSGRDGLRMFQFNGDGSHPEFGGLTLGLGDVDGDGTSDFLIGTNHRRGGAQTLHRVYSGATRQVLYELAPLEAMLVRAVALDDVNADGRPDFAIAEPLWNRVTRFSGADGSVVGVSYGANLYTNHNFGMSLSTVPDATGDGLPDLLVGASQPTLQACSAGHEITVGGGFFEVLSSTTGAWVRTEMGASLGAEFGACVQALGDANGDGFGDFLVSEPNLHGVGLGRILALSGNPAVFAPTPYCAGGAGAELGASGSTSLSAASLDLEVSGAWPNSVAVGHYSARAIFLPFGSWNGHICTLQPRFRLPGAVRLDGSGNGTYPLRFQQAPVAMGSGAITAGSTWNFQFLYRQSIGDPVNTTGALRVTFQN